MRKLRKKKHENQFDDEIKREWRHLVKFGDENRLLFTAFVVVITAMVVIQTAYVISQNDKPSNNQGQSSALPDPNQLLTTGEVGQNGSIRAEVGMVGSNDKPDPAFPISADETVLTMKVKITNLTADIQNFIPVNHLFMHTTSGDFAAVHPSIYVKDPLVSQEVKPGQTFEGSASFAIKKYVTSPLLYVQPGWDNSGPLVFDVNK